MTLPEGFTGQIEPPFSGLEFSNPSKDDRTTPITTPMNSIAWVPPVTPAKQRRTVHGTQNETRFTHNNTNNNNSKQLRSAGKDPRRSLTSRKRPSTDLSQFSALEIEEVMGGGGPHNCLPVGARRGGSSAAVLFPSQPASPQPDWDPRRAPSASLLRISPERLEYSQADTEYSNFFSRRILVDYREVKELGCGSFGRVTLYEEISTGTLVAIKVSPPLTNPEQRQRFVRERAILNLVRRFPHVVQLLDAWEEGRNPQMYLQLEYCKGGSVAGIAEQRRQRDERWDEREIFIFIGHMALALDALHSANIAHIDFKPENVLIDENGAYKLSDFGCSVALNEEGKPRKLFTSNNQKSGGILTSATSGLNYSNLTDITILSMPTQLSIMSVEEGDCRYLCSDMLNQKRYLKAGDMFSFGISLFELMSGEALPHHGAPFLELRSSPPMEILERRGYSTSLLNLVAALMHKDPTARPTALDVLRFFKLPPQTSQLVTKWTSIEKERSSKSNEEEKEEEEKDEFKELQEERGTLLNVRFMHAALEVSSRLLDVTRQKLETDSLSSNNNNNNNNNSNFFVGGGVIRRPRIDVDESCTPKTPIVNNRFNTG